MATSISETLSEYKMVDQRVLSRAENILHAVNGFIFSSDGSSSLSDKKGLYLVPMFKASSEALI